MKKELKLFGLNIDIEIAKDIFIDIEIFDETKEFALNSDEKELIFENMVRDENDFIGHSFSDEFKKDIINYLTQD